MFFILSKLLFYLVMPISIVFFLLGYALFTKNRKRSKRALIVALGFLYVCSNSFLVNSAYKKWEIPVVPFSAIDKEYEIGIILTGIANSYKEPKDRVYLGQGADRVIHPVTLYKKGIVKKLLISEESGSLLPTEEREAAMLKKVLIQCGVKEKDIYTEVTSRNTYENAVESVQFIDSLYQNTPKSLLITSAFHMRRSLACFEKQGLLCDPFPVDFRGDQRNTFDTYFIPKENAFSNCYTLVHEMIGYIVYATVGNI